MLPSLIFVVSLSMVKDAYEDYQKHKADDEENNSKCIVFNKLTGNFEERNWRSIQIGDLVKVKSEKGFKQIPADMIVIQSEGTDGHC